MQKFLLSTASLLGAIAVALGAVGAHLLQNKLQINNRIETFDTASKYLFYHAITLLIIGILAKKVSKNGLKYASVSILCGVLFFSGSLYLLSLTNASVWAMITPIGGLLMILGWIILFITIIKTSFNRLNSHGHD